MRFENLKSQQRPIRWSTALSQSGIEIGLGGNDAGPYQANEVMATACRAMLTNMMDSAVAYISKCVTPTVGISGEPEIEWIDFGLSNYGEHQECELYFSDDATYVLWAVRFDFTEQPTSGDIEFAPVGFSRRDW